MKLSRRFLLTLSVLLVYLAVNGCAPPKAAPEEDKDKKSPVTAAHSPADNAINVSAATNIVVHVRDTGDGVKGSTIVMQVNGDTVTPVITGTAADYTVTYNPALNFDAGQLVSVSIRAADFRGNSIQDNWSFTVKNAALRGALVTPTGVLASASVEIFSSFDTTSSLFDTTSDGNGEFYFEVGSGQNYLLHAVAGNVELYGILPYVNDFDADYQLDATSTAMYLLAQYYVANDLGEGITCLTEVDVMALRDYLQADSTLVDQVANVINTGGSLASLAGSVAPQAALAMTPAVSLGVSQNSPSVGDDFYVYINAAFVTDLYGVNLGLEFDSTKVQIKGTTLPNAGQDTYVAGTFLENATTTVNHQEGDLGKLVIGMTKVGLVAGNDGSGNLLRLTFKALAPGSAEITFDSTSDIRDSNIEIISPTGFGSQSLNIQ